MLTFFLRKCFVLLFVFLFHEKYHLDTILKQLKLVWHEAFCAREVYITIIPLSKIVTPF